MSDPIPRLDGRSGAAPRSPLEQHVHAPARGSDLIAPGPPPASPHRPQSPGRWRRIIRLSGFLLFLVGLIFLMNGAVMHIITDDLAKVLAATRANDVATQRPPSLMQSQVVESAEVQRIEEEVRYHLKGRAVVSLAIGAALGAIGLFRRRC